MSDKDAEKKKVALLTLSASQILGGGLSPGRTFAFRQNAAAAQAEQRGESEPLHQTGRHRASQAPGAALSIHSSKPVIRFTPKKLWKECSKVLYFSRNRKTFCLAWETLTAPPPGLSAALSAALGHTLLDALTSSGGRPDAPAAAQVHITHCSRFKYSYFTSTLLQ